MLGPIQQRCAGKADITADRIREPRDAVEHRGLPGTVGTDERVDRAFLDIHRKVIDGNQSAESNAEMLQRQDWIHQACASSIPSLWSVLPGGTTRSSVLRGFACCSTERRRRPRRSSHAPQMPRGMNMIESTRIRP